MTVAELPLAAPGADPGQTAQAQVEIKDHAFHPAAITVPVGSMVTWVNDDSDAHTVTSDDGQTFNHGLGGGEKFSFTFAKAGTYPYHCSLHPMMKGTVTVP